MINILVTRKFLLQLLAWLVVTVAVLTVCAECESSSSGWYQGGGDSVPQDR
jgi:hypothetical protein